MNYPNMSYCMCENTHLALDQVFNAMAEDPATFFSELSHTERRALKDLFLLCNDFVRFMDELAEDELAEELDIPR